MILGTGWGSYSVLRNLKKRKHLSSLYDILVISPRNHFLFTPLLASTTVGTLEFRSIIEPIRNAGFRNEHHFHLARAVALDVEGKTVRCTSVLDPNMTYDVPYDKLVIGVGAISNDFNVPGVKEHAFFLKEIADARLVRNKILTNFELATQLKTSDEERMRLLHFVVVGGGPTGVEFSAEFYDFLQQDLKRLYPDETPDVRITLVEAQEILSAFDDRLRAYTEDLIRKRHAMKIVKAVVTEVTPTHVRFKDGSKLSCGMVVWSTGLAPRDFTKSLSVEKTPQGQIVVDERLHVVSDPHNSVFALGDCTQIRNQPHPCTAQVAERQGRYLASIMGHTPTSDKPFPPEFELQTWGMLAYVGGYRAIHDTKLDRSKGFHSWVLWRSAYATMLGSWRLRMQVPIDWAKTWFFGRDTSRF